MSKPTFAHILALIFSLCASMSCSAANPGEPPLTDNDPLSWLGPLPPGLSNTMADQMLDNTMETAIRELAPDIIKANVSNFVCRKPAEAGATPGLDAVGRYIEKFPESSFGGNELDDLFNAASQGNWLARGWVFVYLWQQKPRTAEAQYRLAQLTDLLRQHKTGTLYMIIASEYASHPLFTRLGKAKEPSQFELAAAQHQHYPLQYKVGRYLQQKKDRKLSRIGKTMEACALESLPAYRRLLTSR